MEIFGGQYGIARAHTLQDRKIENAVLSKRGKQTKEDKEREGSKAFKQLRNKHSAVESNINMLELHGLSRCRDKGLNGFKRCLGLRVLAYNLHVMGNSLKAIEKEKEAKQRNFLFKKAAQPKTKIWIFMGQLYFVSKKNPIKLI